jgi:ATP-dependent Clp protease adaptor protein ClpS
MGTSAPALPERDVESTIERVPPYKVVLLDDPVTTMEFVVNVLTHVFQKDAATAARLTWEVHTTGASHVATLPLEQAELRQAQVHDAAKAAGFPFRCVIEPV